MSSIRDYQEKDLKRKKQRNGEYGNVCQEEFLEHSTKKEKRHKTNVPSDAVQSFHNSHPEKVSFKPKQKAGTDSSNYKYFLKKDFQSPSKKSTSTTIQSPRVLVEKLPSDLSLKYTHSSSEFNPIASFANKTVNGSHSPRVPIEKLPSDLSVKYTHSFSEFNPIASSINDTVNGSRSLSSKIKSEQGNDQEDQVNIDPKERKELLKLTNPMIKGEIAEGAVLQEEIGQELCVEDIQDCDVFLVTSPRSISISALKGIDLRLNGRSKVRMEDDKALQVVLQEVPEKTKNSVLLLPSRKEKMIMAVQNRISGIIRMRIDIGELPDARPWDNLTQKVPLPKNMKKRNPLLILQSHDTIPKSRKHKKRKKS